MKKVHLVLGSGGARGMAHIGVIEMLEEEGYEIYEEDDENEFSD